MFVKEARYSHLVQYHSLALAQSLPRFTAGVFLSHTILCPVAYCYEVPLKESIFNLCSARGLSTSPTSPRYIGFLCIGVLFSKFSFAKATARQRRNDH